MDGSSLRDARLHMSWTQYDAAIKLGVTQAYLSMVERGARPVSPELASRMVEVFDIPATALPLVPYESRHRDNAWFKHSLGSLGYAGFAYLPEKARMNPAQLLMEALDTDNLDSRVTEALPWLVVHYPGMDWDWLTWNAKVHNRQNRLAFVVTLASQFAAKRAQSGLEKTFSDLVDSLERSRLAAEDTLSRESMTLAERSWLRSHRAPAAMHWNLLTDLAVEQLEDAFF